MRTQIREQARARSVPGAELRGYPRAARTMECVETAWGEYRAELLRFLRHKLGERGQAEDLLQEVFVRAAQHRETFCSLDNRRSWLFKVARNALIDFYRRHRPTQALPEDLGVEPTEQDPLRALCACLVEQIEALQPAYREALVLSELQGVPQKDVARAQGISLSGAKSRVQRARVSLRDRLVECCRVELDKKGRVRAVAGPAARRS